MTTRLLITRQSDGAALHALSLESAASWCEIAPDELAWALEQYGRCDTDEYRVQEEQRYGWDEIVNEVYPLHEDKGDYPEGWEHAGYHEGVDLFRSDRGHKGIAFWSRTPEDAIDTARWAQQQEWFK